MSLELLTRSFLDAGFEQPAFEARALLKEAPDEATAEKWLRERLRGVPLAYLVGKKGFYKHEFLVEPGVLIPRPETEHVVEVALHRAPSFKKFADLGCGSGCLGLSLLLEKPEARLFAVDSSQASCQVSARNAEALGCDERVVVIQKSIPEWEPQHRFELIVANPPYIALSDADVQPSVHAFEPHAALYSGSEGLDALRTWSAWAYHYLAPGGIFVTEIGAGQNQAVKDIINALSFREVESFKDYSGKDRVVSAKK